MMGIHSKFEHELSGSLPTYVNPDHMLDINHVRSRRTKSTISIESLSQPAHFVLSTGECHANGKENHFPQTSRFKHNKTQIMFLSFTAFIYFLHTLITYLPESIPTLFRTDQFTNETIQNESLPYTPFWSSMKSIPITRVYTSDLRPNLEIEQRLLRLADIGQTLWLVYILSYIPRKTNLGYIYRHPDIFNTGVCLLLISSLSLQAISQTPLPPEISSVCLLISFILLSLTGRLIAMKVLKYQEKIKSSEFHIIRYFLFNSLFLYTISIGYLTICASIECIAFHLDPNLIFLTTITTIGLSLVFILLLIYFLLDQFIYEKELRSIWTPYLFIAITFSCPSLRQLFSNEIVYPTHDWNFYLLWALFSTTLLMIFIRICRQILIQYRAMNVKSHMKSYIPQVTLSSNTSESIPLNG